MITRVIALAVLLLMVAVNEANTHEQILKNAGMHKLKMSSNWKEIAVHVNNHWHDLDSVELEAQNRLLDTSMNLGSQYFSDAERTQALAHEIQNFVSAYGSTMPGSTLSLLSKKATQLHRRAAQLTEKTSCVGGDCDL